MGILQAYKIKYSRADGHGKTLSHQGSPLHAHYNDQNPDTDPSHLHSIPDFS